NGLKDVAFGTASYSYFFQNNGRATVSDFEIIGEKTYYFQTNGRAVKSAFYTVAEDLYYFDKNGAVITGGWFCLGDGYYFANGDGHVSTNTVVEGYKVDASGKSTTKYRIRQYANKYTNASMTNQEKIDALYNWVLTNDMYYIRTYEHVKADWVWKDSWVDDMAASQMDKNGGNCFRYAAFLGMMIHEATGLPVKVFHGNTGNGSPHGWPAVLQDGTWYVYDVELQKHSAIAKSRCYKVPVGTGTLHLNGIGTALY
ncbi:MAG: hypothetical protein IKW10_01625, partial [Oscillospiraceae bacterium]|nr:hypothetical protein [Oscillospiraceae bacterium]